MSFGYMAFPGIQAVLRGTFTLGHGIAPGIANLDVAPQSYVPPVVGTLQIVYGGLVLGFPNCAIDHASIRYDPSGYVVGLRILDRRWLWRHGIISGFYNQRKPDGTLRTETEKTPQELAVLCLQAMGEAQYSVGEMPNLDRPAVNWDADNPSAMLNAVCEEVGARVVLGIDNTVSIRRLGVGASLPTAFAKNADDAVNQANLPEKIRVVCAPTLFQARFTTRAVGLDTDNKVKEINDLSYKPAAGWEKEDPGTFPTLEANVFANPTSEMDIKKLSLAKQTVFRWYWIDGIANGTSKTTFLQGYGEVERWQILPVRAELLKTENGPDGLVSPLPAKAYGAHYDENFRLTTLPDGSPIKIPFDILGNGIAVFSQPLFKISGAQTTVPTTIQVEATCAVLDRTTLAPVRHYFEEVLPNGITGAGTQIALRDDIARTIETLYDSGLAGTITGVNDSLATTDLQQKLQYRWLAAAAEYANATAQTVEYAGILPINLDGAIQQIEWSVGPEGHATRASRNTEFSLRVPSYRRAQEIADDPLRLLLPAHRKAKRESWRVRATRATRDAI